MGYGDFKDFAGKNSKHLVLLTIQNMMDIMLEDYCFNGL